MSSRDEELVDESLPFLVALDEDAEDNTKGLFRRGEREVALRDIPVAVLRHNLERTVAALRGMFDDIAAEPGRLRLREAQFSFEVSAKGGLNFVGTTEVGSTGAITLTFGE